jgi:hypothetical protein
MTTPKYEIFDDGARRGEKIVVERHLNFEYRYEIVLDHVRGDRHVWFYPVQVRPSIKKCERGKCTDTLCTIPDDEFTDDVFEWTQYYTDPTPGILEGRKVVIDDKGDVRIEHPPAVMEEEERGIDLNWRRLRNMAQPIVDEQLGKLAMNQKWRDTPVKLHLGSLLVDTDVVRIDEASYYNMCPKGDNSDMDEIEGAWNKRMTEKRVGKAAEEDNQQSKKFKIHHDECTYPGKKDYHEMKEAAREEGVGQKENVASVGVNNELNQDGPQKDNGRVDDNLGKVIGCNECCENPCVWLTKKEEMIDFDEDEHGHLSAEDGPPNNIRRKKVYRQMVLYINEGGTGKGVRLALPKCVENGVRKLFPSPTFMGFKDK